MPEHLMLRIERSYGDFIRQAAKRYASRTPGITVDEAYSDILCAVYDQVRRRRVKLRDERLIRAAIRQQATYICRKELTHRGRFTGLPEASTPREPGAELPVVSDEYRCEELKARIRALLDPQDAAIVIETAFPSDALKEFARKHPRHPGRRRKGQGITVTKWHVAKFFNMSYTRTRKALKLAAEVMDDILG